MSETATTSHSVTQMRSGDLTAVIRAGALGLNLEDRTGRDETRYSS